jgi:hypothetical protein
MITSRDYHDVGRFDRPPPGETFEYVKPGLGLRHCESQDLRSRANQRGKVVLRAFG